MTTCPFKAGDRVLAFAFVGPPKLPGTVTGTRDYKTPQPLQGGVSEVIKQVRVLFDEPGVGEHWIVCATVEALEDS